MADGIVFGEDGLYIPQEWLDGVGEGNFTPISAERMNHIEQGIRGLSEAWDSQSQLYRIEAGGKSYSVPANAADGIDVPIPVIDGYSPVSINEWAPNNNSVSTLRLSVADSYVRVTLRNYTASAQSGTYCVKVLYMRSDSMATSSAS